MIGRATAFLYGTVCYFIFLATFLYAIAFLGDFGFVKSIDSGAEGPVGQALAVNAALLGIFAVQHSVMARPWFKRAGGGAQHVRVVREPGDGAAVLAVATAGRNGLAS